MMLFWSLLTVLGMAQAALHLEVPVVSREQINRIVPLLPYPGYLALALENVGTRLSGGGKVRVERPHALVLERKAAIPFKAARVLYEGSQGSRAFYRVSLDWQWLGITKSIQAKVTLDRSMVSRGKLELKVDAPMAGMIPEALVQRGKQFLQRVATPEVERRLLSYLLDKGAFPSLEMKILADAYNRSAGQGGSIPWQPGDAESLSEQVFFLITLGVWAVGLPLLWWNRRRRATLRPTAQ